jgi:hypothetical protein
MELEIGPFEWVLWWQPQVLHYRKINGDALLKLFGVLLWVNIGCCLCGVAGTVLPLLLASCWRRVCCWSCCTTVAHLTVTRTVVVQ